MTAIILLSNKDLIKFAEAHTANDLTPSAEMFSLMIKRLSAAETNIAAYRKENANLLDKETRLKKLLNEIELGMRADV